MSPADRVLARDLAVLRCELHHGRRRRTGRMRAALASRLRAVPARRWTP